jgi:AbrB family looped-hinge helix DNA binding protein
MRQPKTLGRARITSKFQITIPAEVRREFGLRVGEQLEFVKDERGYVQLKRHFDESPFKKWVGAFKHLDPDAPWKTTDEFIEAIRGPVEPGDVDV